PKMDTLQGHLLIASTGLLDPNFARTVVLIAVHGDEGALGLILNRELGVSLQQVWQQVSQMPCIRSENARHGGPVEGTLMALHDVRTQADVVLTDALYVATELSALESLAGSDEGRVLFYIGHAGWGPGQLETELSQGSWLVLRATDEYVFSDRDSLA